MEAIEFTLGATKLLEVRYGTSEFKKVDDFWYDFKPHGGEKTTAFCPNLIKRTPRNEELVECLRRHYENVKRTNDVFDQEMYKLRNQFER